MRCLLLIVSLLFCISPLVYGQEQYSEGACILLQQQIDRFSAQKQSSNFRGATREYEQFCKNPTSFMPVYTKKAANVETKPEATKGPENKATTDIAKLSTAAKPVTKSKPTEQVVATITEITKEQVAANEDANLAKNAVLTTSKQASNSEPEVAIPEVIVTEDTIAQAPVREIASATEVRSDIMDRDLVLELLNDIPMMSAHIVAFLLAIFLLTNWLGLNLPGFKGVFAEYKLNRLLRWRLSKHYKHFRKLKLVTAKDEPVVIDHLVFSPFGIFVITVKGDRGRISGSEAQANWIRQYFGRTKQLMNPLHQNYKNLEAVKHLLQLSGSDATQIVHSVAAFSRLAKFEADIPENVTYIDKVPAYIKQFKEPCLTDEQQNRYLARLKQAKSE
ncbi:nuclease-related domain-containing protein [Rheinheimera sp. WS51]|uniref:nuclease-related domain-containing protein n=1 Tax=Rheinheimera sp. WS51 TaxID=3425886 RepID=UPI003D93E13C